MHCAAEGVTPAEVEQVFENILDTDQSRSSGRPVVFGLTAAGRHLMVVFEVVDDTMVYPITAYEVSPRQTP